MYKLGVVGAGRWGSIVATRIYETKTAEIAVVCDIDPARAGFLAERLGAKAVMNLSELEKFKDLLGVIVAVNIDRLAQVSAELIRMGFNVLIEKPVASSLDGVRMLRSLAESKGVVAMPGFIVRFDPISIWIKEYLSRSGESLEDLYLFRLSRRPPWARVNSILLDLAIHDIDLARYLIGGDIDPVGWSIHDLSEDQAFTMYAKHRRGHVFINVDGVSRNKIRKVLASLSKSYMEGDYINQYIVRRSIEGNDYEHLRVKDTEALVREIRVFMDLCRGVSVEAPTLLDAEKAHEVISRVLSGGRF